MPSFMARTEWPSPSDAGREHVCLQEFTDNEVVASLSGRAAVRWSGAAVRRAKRTSCCLPVTRCRAQAYRVDHIERRRVAEPGRAEHGRRALRDAPRDGRARRTDSGVALRF